MSCEIINSVEENGMIIYLETTRPNILTNQTLNHILKKLNENKTFNHPRISIEMLCDFFKEMFSQSKFKYFPFTKKFYYESFINEKTGDKICAYFMEDKRFLLMVVSDGKNQIMNLNVSFYSPSSSSSSSFQSNPTPSSSPIENCHLQMKKTL